MPNLFKRLVQVFCLYLFLFAFGNSANGQTTKIDELLGQLNKNNSDTAQLKILRKLSVAYSTVDPEKKYYYANQYRLLAEKNGIDTLVASAYLDMGNAHALRSNLDSALYYFKIGHEKAKAINFLNGIARGYINIGYTYDRLDRKKESVLYYEQALKIYKKINFKKGINQCITNLGSMYFDLKEYKTADHYFKQVLENLKETPNDEMGLGSALYSLGGTNRRLGQSKTAMAFYRKSLAIREKIGDLNGIGLSNWGIGQLYVEQKEFKKALGYLNIALNNNRSLQNLYQECAVLMTVAEAYIGLKDYKTAEKNAELALIRAKESSSKIAISLSLDVLADVYAAQKDYANALKFKAEYNAVNDSLKNNETTKEVILKDLRRVSTDNKVLEKDNKTITAKNSEYIIVISIITILLIAVAVLLALYYKRNLEKKAINLQLQKQKQEIADVNEELGALNEELTTQMDIISVQNVELEKLNTVKNKFFSIVSHDLRSPLNNLKMLFELYRTGDLNETELGEMLTRLEDTIYNTANFLDNLLEWSKSQLEGITVKPSYVEINNIVDENIKLMDSQIKLKQLKVTNKMQGKIIAFADPNMINVVIRNILSNAIKFCSSADEVIFSATQNDEKVIFSIGDTGPGISDTDKTNLFNLAYTISTGSAGEKGYHIGLILCKDMIQQNKGSIEVETKLGIGTTFNITLPVKG
ncbi:MAG: tetratricopeptide repeat protein [Pedobacter sp.]|nr:MAG: tetratricopeptide repeat protein [Pedobacter sp.]